MTRTISAPGVGAAPASSDTTTKTTRALLGCGVVAGPLFVVAGLIHAFTRDGFDLRRHPFSMLSLGDFGWLQITNFVVSGLLFLACAVGMWRVLHPGRGGTWGPLLIGAVGVSLIAGGVFVADPAFGFPAGTPAGPPDVASWHGNLHGLAFAVGMLSLIAACLVFARRFRALAARGWATYCTVTGGAFVILSAAGVVGGDFRLVAVAIVLGWGWMSIVSGAGPPDRSAPASTRASSKGQRDRHLGHPPSGGGGTRSRYPADGGGTVELLTGKESRDDRPDLERCRSDFGRGEAHRARGKCRRRPLTAVVQ
jgi:hypothetical protein